MPDKDQPPDLELMTDKEVWTLLRISRSTLCRNLTGTFKGLWIKVGGARRWPRAGVVEYFRGKTPQQEAK